MSVQIDKHVPIPLQASGHRQAARKYPTNIMEVGDSFFVPDKQAQQFGYLNTHYAPKKFTAKTLTENGVEGVRVWRIE
jgi:hypothetical protein